MNRLPLPLIIAIPYALIYLVLYLVLESVPRGMYCPQCDSKKIINRWQPGPLMLLTIGFPFSLLLLLYERFACEDCGKVFRGLVTEYMRQGPDHYCPDCMKDYGPDVTECPKCKVPLSKTWFCPRCKAEYQQEGGKCPECRVELKE
ncbi:MAG: hypothetical protein ACYS8W_03775 [Planctomycetota bacterium]|jgi:predicted amidophosphoribosyltransferase